MYISPHSPDPRWSVTLSSPQCEASPCWPAPPERSWPGMRRRSCTAGCCSASLSGCTRGTCSPWTPQPRWGRGHRWAWTPGSSWSPRSRRRICVHARATLWMDSVVWVLFPAKEAWMRNLLVLEVLDGSQTLEWSVDHDGQTGAESFTFLHTASTHLEYDVVIYSRKSRTDGRVYLCEVRTTALLSWMTLMMEFHRKRLERGSMPVVGSS